MSLENSMIETVAIVVFGVAITTAFLFIMIQLRQLHVTMNSRLDELLRTTNALARAEGFKAGQEDRNHRLDRLRHADKALDP